MVMIKSQNTGYQRPKMCEMYMEKGGKTKSVIIGTKRIPVLEC